MAKQRRSSAPPALLAAAPTEQAEADPSHGNAALAASLLEQAEQGRGTEVALDRGRVLGMFAGLGIGALNALGSGGVNAALNPAGYWETMNEPARPALQRGGGAAMAKPL